MYFEECNESGNESSMRLVKAAYRERDELYWKSIADPEPITTSGMVDIKWKELYDKWGKYIPEDKKKEWKYYNEDPGPERRKLVRKHTKESKTTRKGRTRTDADATKQEEKKQKVATGGHNSTDIANADPSADPRGII